MCTARATKIIASLGLASNSRRDIQRLFDAGADMFRLDMRYGTRAGHLECYRIIRELETESGRSIGVLMDLQGPQPRIGNFRQGRIELVPGQRFQLDAAPGLGDHERATLPYPDVYQVVAPGALLYLDDGRVRLRVVSVAETEIATVVEAGGQVRGGALLTAPHLRLPIPALTPKDLDDIAFGRDIGVDWLALSFVQCERDIAALRAALPGDGPKVMAKIGKAAALANLPAIADAADAVMVCRDGLGVELPLEEVPFMQRRIVQECRARGRPVVVAAQVLESMATSAVPTRAEANDIAAAVYDGVDALLLSGETAIGMYASETVSTADRIIRRVEADNSYAIRLAGQGIAPRDTGPTEALSAAVRSTAELLPLSFAGVFTLSGTTCLAVARMRPRVPILAVSPSATTARMLTLAWGVHALHMQPATASEDIVAGLKEAGRRFGCLVEGRPYVAVAAIPTQGPAQASLFQVCHA
ncbi:MAG TPA: pyruvate kinase [Noviherbaspirillum sp.]|jgi:pyruvate kinase|uniref:pyruvate kinase n=1 Tax=Noviherbaspirillum sp. TaxID=1926288 RepID=UPI002F935866